MKETRLKRIKVVAKDMGRTTATMKRMSVVAMVRGMENSTTIHMGVADAAAEVAVVDAEGANVVVARIASMEMHDLIS